ncbi:hypothetical protein GCM10011339_39400 [Echinicola rosea]|uniref:Rhamnosyl transferase n=1 Tax=Echinicola rosea TaxID=1807691 RepID=A0ABQ1VAS3_9BACT|nr:hypothetical protein GCM10011339_39400 [Echinicola rosea]
MITRFNVEYLEKVEANLSISVDDWLERRFELFFTYCYPSVVQQSEMDFTWLIYFDLNTPDAYIERILKKDFAKVIKPAFATTWKNINENIRGEISHFDIEENDLIISSRLDNDDALSADYIITIQEAVKSKFLLERQLPFAIDLKNGLVYSSKESCLYSVSRKSNPFISLVASNQGNLETVFDYQHQEITSRFKSIQISGKPLWFQNIHDTNISNRAYGKLKLFGYESLQREFGVNVELGKVRVGRLITMKTKEVFRRLSKMIFKKCSWFQ